MVPASGYREGAGGRIDRQRRRISAWEHRGICSPVLRDVPIVIGNIDIGGIAAPESSASSLAIASP
jgi:hypothetical protein